MLLGWVYDCFECGELDKQVGNEQVKKKILERMVRVGLCRCQEDPAPHPNTPSSSSMTASYKLCGCDSRSQADCFSNI